MVIPGERPYPGERTHALAFSSALPLHWTVGGKSPIPCLSDINIPESV